MWENKKRISLSFTIHTGAIKGSSSLLWSSDLYRGIHKQKLDAYCEYRAWPRSYEKHGGEVACLTGIFFLHRIPDGWTRSWNCWTPLTLALCKLLPSHPNWVCLELPAEVLQHNLPLIPHTARWGSLQVLLICRNMSAYNTEHLPHIWSLALGLTQQVLIFGRKRKEFVLFLVCMYRCVRDRPCCNWSTPDVMLIVMTFPVFQPCPLLLFIDFHRSCSVFPTLLALISVHTSYFAF